jgi:hypothetical protein
MNRGVVIVSFLVFSVWAEIPGAILPMVVFMVMIVMMPAIVIRVVMVLG